MSIFVCSIQKLIAKIGAATLGVYVLIMGFISQTALAQGIPNYKPDFNNPLSPLLSKAVGLFLGVIIVVLLGVAVASLSSAAVAFRSGRSGKVVGLVGSAVACFVVVAFIVGGIGSFNPWINYFK